MHLLLAPGTVAWSVGCPFASSGPAMDSHVWHILLWKNNFPHLLIQVELVVSYWQKNGHLILVNCLGEACPGTVWLLVADTVPTLPQLFTVDVKY